MESWRIVGTTEGGTTTGEMNVRTKKLNAGPGSGSGGGSGSPQPIIVTFSTTTDCNGDDVYQVSHTDSLMVLPGQKIVFIYPVATGKSIYIPLGGIFENGDEGSDQIFQFRDLPEPPWSSLFTPGGSVSLPESPTREDIRSGLRDIPLVPGFVRPGLGWESLDDLRAVILTVRNNPAPPQGTRWPYAVHDEGFNNFAIMNSPPDMFLGP